jgi:peptidoglycan/xylan/chitin deacetylase (PgdA/CDA1 family)
VSAETEAAEHAPVIDPHSRSGGDARARQGAIPRFARAAVRHSVAAIGSRIDDHSRAPRLRLSRGLTVFVFHEVTATPSEFQRGSRGYVSPEVFRKQIEWIGERFEFIAPTALLQLGGRGRLSPRAALISFDDAWAGSFRVGLPILGSLDVPALCFLNMATVQGTPDLSAVRRYERLHPPSAGPRFDRRLDADEADAVLQEIAAVYQHHGDYARFQGATATREDLDAVLATWDTVWFGSHLYHHWDIDRISDDLFARSLRANARALSAYGNSLPALATPYGRELHGRRALAQNLGVRVVFIATGGQNRDPGAPVLDRLVLEPEPSGRRDWWYSTYRRGLFGSLAS